MADFNCEVPGCGFQSTDWPTPELRDTRAAQHLDEHETEEPMQELHDFRVDNGVEV